MNSLVEVADETVLVGTINDSIWLWKNGMIEAVFGACPRSVGFCSRAEWVFAKSDDDRLFVASSSFAPRRTEELESLAARISEEIIPVHTSASFLGFAGGELVGVSNSGTVSVIDTATGKPIRELDLQLEPQSFVYAVSFATSQLIIATTAACLGLDLERGLAPTVLAEGYCSSGLRQRDGTLWLATSRLFRHDSQGWQIWEPEQSGATRASVIVEDGNSNIWVGAATGLWRYVDIAKDIEFSGERSDLSSIVATTSGDAVIGMQSGEVWLVRRDLTRLNLLPPDTTAPASAYYGGAIVARDVSGHIWALNANGLFKLEASGRSHKVAPFPIPLVANPRSAAALAVSATGRACVGLVWSNEVVCLVDGKWRTTATLLEDIGGSAVGAVAFTEDDTLIAAGVLSVRTIGATSEEFGPFSPVPFGNKHLFSAVVETTLVPGADVVASGGWGGTVFLRRIGDTYVETGYRPRPQDDHPYLIRQLVSHPQLGLLAAADERLFIWQGAAIDGQWVSLREVDPRLTGGIMAVAPSSGRSFWVASESRLSLIDLPSANPQVRFVRFPEGDIIAQNSVTYHLSVPGLVGLPALKTIAIVYDPVIPNAARVIRGPQDRVDLAGLNDWTDYRISAIVTDGFLNAGLSATSTFAVQLPFYQNPYTLLAAFVATVAFVGLLVTRRGPTGFLLRSLGGLKWSTLRSASRFVLEVQQVNPRVIRYELTSPSAQNPITLAIEVPALRLEAAPHLVLPELTALAEEELAAESDEFELIMTEASRMLGSEALPDGIRFIINENSGGSISLELSKSLLWLPVELADDGHGDQLLLRYAIGRQVSGDSFAAAPPLQTSRLKVVLFAPADGGQSTALDQTAIEISSIASAARNWGADVTIVKPDATKSEVLKALCSAHMFHYAGHAQFLPGAAGESYLPIRGDLILAEDIATALKSTQNPRLLFAFINGCGTSREANWERGAEIYGFASAFLNNASYFIGAQWPIHDTYAASIAKDFYARLFPPSYSLWWRLVRRTPLQGLPFAEALRLAQVAAKEGGPASVQTWSSYVFYGDPTQRLVLE